EGLYLLLSLAALWGVANTAKSQRWWYAAAVCVGLATLTRSVGTALLLAFCAYLALHRQPRMWRLMLISVTPLLLWTLLRPPAGHEGSYVGFLVELARALLGKRSSQQWALEKIGGQFVALWK